MEEDYIGMSPSEETLRLEGLLNAFVRSCRAKRLSSETLKWYEWLLSDCHEYVKNSALSWDDTDALDYFLGEYLEERGVGDYTVHVYYRALRRFFNWLEKRKQLPNDNPITMVDSPTLPRPYPRGIEQEDVERLLTGIKPDTWLDKRDRTIILFLWDTGVRVSELCRLEVGDLRFQQRKALIRNGKEEKDRFIYFGRRTQVFVEEWLETRNDKAKCSRVFINRWGEPFTRRGITAILNRRQAQVGIEGACNPHAFRHGFATAYLDNYGCIHNLQNLMGHATLRLTEVYLKSTDKRAKTDPAEASPGDHLLKTE
jgi:site-specific recombinase XerD